MSTWIKEPNELAEMMVGMSFGGMNELADDLYEILKDRQAGTPEYDPIDRVEIADVLWSWASGRMEVIQEEREEARKKAEIAKKIATAA